VDGSRAAALISAWLRSQFGGFEGTLGLVHKGSSMAAIAVSLAGSVASLSGAKAPAPRGEVVRRWERTRILSGSLADLLREVAVAHLPEVFQLQVDPVVLAGNSLGDPMLCRGVGIGLRHDIRSGPGRLAQGGSRSDGRREVESDPIRDGAQGGAGLGDCRRVGQSDVRLRVGTVSSPGSARNCARDRLGCQPVSESSPKAHIPSDIPAVLFTRQSHHRGGGVAG
jgi:hypothetical protein